MRTIKDIEEIYGDAKYDAKYDDNLQYGDAVDYTKIPSIKKEKLLNRLLKDVQLIPIGSWIYAQLIGIKVKPTYLALVEHEDEKGFLDMFRLGVGQKIGFSAFIEKEDANYVIVNNRISHKLIMALWPVPCCTIINKELIIPKILYGSDTFKLFGSWMYKISSPFVRTEVETLMKCNMTLQLTKCKTLNNSFKVLNGLYTSKVSEDAGFVLTDVLRDMDEKVKNLGAMDTKLSKLVVKSLGIDTSKTLINHLLFEVSGGSYVVKNNLGLFERSEKDI